MISRRLRASGRWLLAWFPGHRDGDGAEPSLSVDVGPSVPMWVVLFVALASGSGAMALLSWPGIAGVLFGCGVAILVIGAALPRSIGPAAWLVLVGATVLVTDGVTGWPRIVWVVGLVATVHLALTAMRLCELLTPRSRIALAVLRERWSVFWRAQLGAQLLGVLAWWTWGVSMPWLAVAGVIGAGVLAWLVLWRGRIASDGEAVPARD